MHDPALSEIPNVLYCPNDVRLELLGDEAACFERNSGVTHVMDAGGAFVLSHIVQQRGIDRDELLANLLASFQDEAAALATLLDNTLSLLLEQGLIRATGAPDANR